MSMEAAEEAPEAALTKHEQLAEVARRGAELPEYERPKRRVRSQRRHVQAWEGAKACWQSCKGPFLCVWHCTQFWTTLSISSIIIWVLYRPDRFHPHVDSAILYALNITAPAANATDQPSLWYDLAVDVSLRNSHHSLKIRYLDIGATALYGGTKLGPADDALPAPFTQGPKNTTVLHPTFQGTVAADSDMIALLENELAAGTVHVRVSVSWTIKYKVGLIQHISFDNYDCWLWFPPPRVGAPAIFDAGTRCWETK